MKTLFLVILFLSVAVASMAKDVSLVWDASPSTDVVGYKVYSNSTTQLPFQTVTDVGGVLLHTFTGLPDDEGLYFAATAYDDAGLESAFSNLVFSRSFVAPEPPSNLGGSSILNNVIIDLK